MNGGTGCVEGTCTVRLKLGKLQVSVKLTIIDMLPAFDLILSDAWLKEHNAILDYGSKTCTVLHKGKMCALRAPPVAHSSMPSMKPVLSFVQSKRLAKQKSEYCLVVVTEAKESVESRPSPTQQNPDLLTPGKLSNVLADYPDVFTDKAPYGGSRVQCDIEVIPVTSEKSVNRLMFRYGPLEMAEKWQVSHLLEQGFISLSTSPYGALVLFVKKPRSTELRRPKKVLNHGLHQLSRILTC